MADYEPLSENLMNAEIAFANKQYDNALSWYKKAIVADPDDLHSLSRAGAISVSKNEFEEAKGYFAHAFELDPGNGDAAFNYANACFFNEEFSEAFDSYLEAERLGVSGDITPKLYYQLATICALKEDTASALVYIKKSEESDVSGMMALDPDLISDKIRLYMLLKDYAGARQSAKKLLAVKPTEYENYMLYFSLLMADESYEEAERTLDDAAKYAEKTNGQLFDLLLERASLYILIAANDDDRAEELYNKAVGIMEEAGELSLDKEQEARLSLARAELFVKIGSFDAAITEAEKVLSDKIGAPEGASSEYIDTVISDDAVEEQLRADVERVEELINNGFLDPDMGAYAAQVENYDGEIINDYGEIFDGQEAAKEEPEDKEKPVRDTDIGREVRENAMFVIMSCSVEKNDFERAAKYASILRHSDNKYYSYYGVYVNALSEGKINGGADKAERSYAEAISYFRNRSFTDHTDTLAHVFRARLYCEQGKFEKAEEIAGLLSDIDRRSILDYIEENK